jgi:error-prone DNA polymerase
MGSRFIRVNGRLQSESGVIHIVAEKIEDFSHWLAELSEEAQLAAAQGSGGWNGREPPGRNFLTQRGKKTPTPANDHEELSRKASSVMPKGRNFQ